MCQQFAVFSCSRFKWAHLTERLNYEKATHHQKLRHEISAAKKESDHFKRKLESSKRAKKSSASGEAAADGKRYDFRMKATDEEIRRQKRKDSLEAVLASAAGSLEAMTTASGSSSSSSLDVAPSPSKKKKSGDKKSASGGGAAADADRRQFLASVFGGGK